MTVSSTAHTEHLRNKNFKLNLQIGNKNKLFVITNICQGAYKTQRNLDLQVIYSNSPTNTRSL
jgi:hypothetical protein